MSSEIAEAPGPPFHQTAHRMSKIRAILTLSDRGTALWEDQLTAQTRAHFTLPSALQRLETQSSSSDPKIERVLYDDALDLLLDQIRLRLDEKLPQVPASPDPLS
jgi:hypothetical protein